MITVPTRNEEELALIKKSGLISARVMKKVLSFVEPGVTLQEIDELATEEILKLGGQPSFKTVPGYYWATCLTINDEVVHGLPRGLELKEGDVLGIDLGTVYQGWHSDMAWSVIVGNEKREASTEKFLKVGEETLWKAISKAVEGNRIGDISSTIQKGIEGAGYSVVKSLAGHGVGRSAHEEPEIPEYGKEGTGMVLKKDMTLAIEVIYAQNWGDVYETDDGWTVATKDGSLGGLFEMTVIVGKKRPEIITDWRGI